ncbi:MAG: hypothetical protein HQL41_07045 [Alphaproteobacteria bacterium]|nr:hypothetical protein [Alphaproteobacteria bacterium]
MNDRTRFVPAPCERGCQVLGNALSFDVIEIERQLDDTGNSDYSVRASRAALDGPQGRLHIGVRRAASALDVFVPIRITCHSIGVVEGIERGPRCDGCEMNMDGSRSPAERLAPPFEGGTERSIVPIHQS